MSNITIIDKVKTLVSNYMSTSNTKPEWLIIDYTTYKEIQVLAEYWPNYALKDPNEGDKFYGLNIAITSSNTKTMGVK